ncbi:MAG TPA: hypothetical protein VLH79_13730 [Chthonomonadales bacterium]|nr:hypothetical protein [Chthonomonadales bacterium]
MQPQERPATTHRVEGSSLAWKPDGGEARRVLTKWWEGQGLALHVTAPRDEPAEAIAPAPSADLPTRWLDAEHRVQASLHHLSRTYHGGVAVPMVNTDVGGPGSLGLFLGAEGRLTETTVWYEPCIEDPDAHRPLRFDDECEWWRIHERVLTEAERRSRGRCLVGFPDLIENVDTLAALRGNERLLLDMVERPEWVERRVDEINEAFFACFERIESLVRSPWEGNAWHAFGIWGPGRTAKVQCDFCCMVSPAMFRRFVQPALTRQCAWLRYSMFHLDGTQALPQLDNLLSIEPLRAIEWTPQAGLPGGGSPRWFDLYRRILAAGKCVQAIGVLPEEVEPLLDAVGVDGMFVTVCAASEEQARDLLRRTGWRETDGEETLS